MTADERASWLIGNLQLTLREATQINHDVPEADEGHYYVIISRESINMIISQLAQLRADMKHG